MGQYADLFDTSATGTSPQAIRANANLLDGSATSPDDAARNTTLARRFGLPPDVVQQYRPEYEARAKVGDAQTVLSASPVLQGWLAADAQRAKLTHDDLDNMGALESSLKYLASAPGAPRGGLMTDVARAARAVVSGAPTLGAGLFGAAAAPFELTGLDSLGGWLRERQRDAKITASLWAGVSPDAGPTERAAFSGLQSTGQNLLTLPLGFVNSARLSGEQAMLGIMGLTTAGQSYGKARDEGVAPVRAIPYAVADAVAEVVTEKYMGAAGLLRNIKAGASAGKLAAYEVLKEVPGEMSATLWQNFNEWASVHPEKSVADWLAEQPADQYQTIIATLVGGGVQIGAVHGAATLSGARAAQAAQAEQTAQRLDALRQLSKASKVLQRDPETFQQFVEEAAQDGDVQDVYVDGRVFAQTLQAAGIDPATLPQAVQDQLPAALAAGADVRIPVADYAARIAPTDWAGALADHLKVSPEAMSRAQAQDWMQSGQASQLREDISRAIDAQQGDNQFRTSQDAVKQQVLDQLTQLGRFDNRVNEPYATLIAAHAAVRAAQLGVMPEEYFQRMGRVPGNTPGPLKVVSGKGAPPRSQTAATSVNVGTPSAQVTPENVPTNQPTEDVSPAILEQKASGAGTQMDGGVFQSASSVENQGTQPKVVAGPVREFDSIQRGTFAPDTNTIRLLQDADLSTFLHESGHFFFESDIALAAELVRSRRDGAGLTEGEEQVLTDVSTLLTWHGLPGNIDEQLTAWYSQDLEAQRAAHERTAESFEKYLFEGRAPSLELQGVFQRFRAWLLNVYKSIRSFLETHPEAGKLNADVRRVFDRMLATNEQIQLAEQGRSMAPMFASADQAGMTPEEFARYHALGVQATQDAVQDLQSRSLRDLQWIQNARGREISKLQRRAQGLRDEMTIEARREVMAQPVYQAWQFLTAEQRREDMSPAEVARADYLQAVSDWNEQRRAIATQAREQAREDLADSMELAQGEKEAAVGEAVKLAVRRWIKNGNPKPRPPDYRPKSDPNHVDPTQDSLLVAIAKLGGIARDSASQHLGVHKDDYRANSGVFGKPVFRKDGGASADGMAELLAAEGYLPTDEHGRADLTDLEERLTQELGGNPQYSNRFDYSQLEEAPLHEPAYPQALAAGRINDPALREVLAGMPMLEPGTDLAERDQQTILTNLRERGMLAPGVEEGMHPDMVAELFGFGSGQELVSELSSATPPNEAITQLADQKMMERYGELSTPDAIARAADAAIHNAARARFVAAEFDALTKAVNHAEPTGQFDKAGRPIQRKVLHSAAADYARQLIDRMKVRDVRPSQWAAAESRAARAADSAMRQGDVATASAEKRNQLLNNLTAKAANQAQDEIEKSLDYLNKFNRDGVRSTLSPDYVDQIDTLLERFDLRRGQSLRTIDKRKSLAKWIEAQEANGFEPEISDKLRNEALRQSWRDMTVAELRELVETVHQIEHLGRLKDRLLTAQDERRFDAVVGEIIGSIRENGSATRPENRTRDTLANKAQAMFSGYMAEHRKVASLVYQLDGFKENGPLWRAFIRPMNDAGNREATMQAEAAENLSKLLEPIRGKGFWQKTHFETLGQSLTRGEQIVIALNMGNAGNRQRLLDGYGWTMEQLQPVLSNLTAAELNFAQTVWDYYETFRPQIAAQERRLYGKEPNWVSPDAIRIKSRDGHELELRGGYYPIMYDPRATGEAQRYSQAEEAKAMMQGAFVASTTRAGHTKNRAEAVMGRPIILTWDAMFRGFNDVVHRLAWQDWAIDGNRLMRDQDIDEAIRGQLGPEGVKQFTDLVRDIAAGDNQSVSALEKSLSYVRAGAAVSGLGFNLMNAMLQPLGLTQSMVRIGPKWVAQGITAWAQSPVELVKQVHEKSEFMRNRARNSNRDVREVYARNMGMSQSMAWVNRAMFMPMEALQMVADMPTWWGAYQKALAGTPLGMDAEIAERQAVALADQAVIDAQGSGQTKDLANIQRGGGVKKLFTVFYGYFSTSYQLAVERGKATNYRDPMDVIRLANDYLLLLVAPAVLGVILKQALQPGGGDDWDMEKLLKKLAGEQISYLLNMLVGVRELTGAAQTLAGVKEFNTAYQGPAALRFFSELDKMATQVHQGDVDAALRRSTVNVSGILLHLPSAQINRTLDGIGAMNDGQTSNPAALAFGYNKPGM